MQTRYENTLAYLKNSFDYLKQQAEPTYARAKEVCSYAYNTVNPWIEAAKMDSPDTDVTHITELNNAIQKLKYLDSIEDTRNLLPEMDEAIATLQNWKETRAEENQKYTDAGLLLKTGKVQSSEHTFHVAKYATMGLSLANILLMFYVFAQNEDCDYSRFAFLNEFCKMPLRLVTMSGALEGSIHLYKAKRFFSQKESLAKAEFAVIKEGSKVEKTESKEETPVLQMSPR